jgi:hypothetical protein
MLLWTSVCWGLLMLAVGCLASFGMAANEILRSLFGFALVFVLPLVSAMAAWRLTRIVGIALLLSVPLAILCVAQNWPDAVQMISKIYLWPHLIFGLSFVLVSRRPAPAP